MIKSPIGIFDSGLGGLTVMKSIVELLPQYDYIYLGDNARAPYGSRSFETVFEYTYQAMEWLFEKNCLINILACNTASAKALRNIQQTKLPFEHPSKKVLGVIRPTTEIINTFTQTNCVGILATSGTINSNSYVIEIEKFHPQIKIYQQACPMWVSLIEQSEWDNEGANFFIKKDIETLLSKNKDIDTILLACTHYPVLINKIKSFLPSHVKVISQGDIVAQSFKSYLNRHTLLEESISKNGTLNFFTTDNTGNFNDLSKLFFGKSVEATTIHLS